MRSQKPAPAQNGIPVRRDRLIALAVPAVTAYSRPVTKRTKLILHVGVPKAGSSALQAFLCRHPVLSGQEGTWAYAVARGNRMIGGRALSRRAAFHPLGLVPSGNDLAAALALLERYGQGSDAPDERAGLILSQEAWLHQADRLARPPGQGWGSIDIMAWVRPQADWFQSAWWQWFAWGRPAMTPQQAWRGLARGGDCHWATHLEAWRDNPLVSRVSARLYRPDRDIVADFLALLGADDPRTAAEVGAGRINRSMSTAHIALYRRAPFLRRPDGGAAMDAALSRILPKGAPAPLVVTPDLAREIVGTMAEDNRRLAAFLPAEDRAAFLADPRWWGSAGMAQKKS